MEFLNYQDLPPFFPTPPSQLLSPTWCHSHPYNKINVIVDLSDKSTYTKQEQISFSPFKYKKSTIVIKQIKKTQQIQTLAMNLYQRQENLVDP